MISLDKETLLGRIEKSDKVVRQCLVIIDNEQTSDERDEGQTHWRNGYGFSVFDAEFGSSLAQQIREGKHLSEKQMFHARRMSRKYASQILRLVQINNN